MAFELLQVSSTAKLNNLHVLVLLFDNRKQVLGVRSTLALLPANKHISKAYGGPGDDNCGEQNRRNNGRRKIEFHASLSRQVLFASVDNGEMGIPISLVASEAIKCAVLLSTCNIAQRRHYPLDDKHCSIARTDRCENTSRNTLSITFIHVLCVLPRHDPSTPC